MAETMEMSALERAAVALCEALTKQEMLSVLVDGRLVVSQSWNQQEFLEPLPIIRAVLEAIREPTPEMIEAAEGADCLSWSPEEGEGLDGVSWGKAWQAMIDALLTPTS
jgi:hypothetical protein